MPPGLLPTYADRVHRIFAMRRSLSAHPREAACPRTSRPRRCSNDTFSVYDILKANFDEAYAGNRAPFPVGLPSNTVGLGVGKPVWAPPPHGA